MVRIYYGGKKKMFRKNKMLIAALVSGMILTSAGSVSQAEAAKKMVLSKKKITVAAGKTTTIKVKNAKKGSKVTWKSSKKTVVKVKKSGVFGAKITGVKGGTAKITCTVKKAKKVKKLACKVTVTSVNKKVETTKAPGVTATPVSSAEASAIASQSPAVSTTPVVTAAATAVTTAEPTLEPFEPKGYEGVGFVNGLASFEDGDVADFKGQNGASCELSDGGRSGKCMLVTDRHSNWFGTSGCVLDVSKTFEKGATYKISGYMKQDSGESNDLSCYVQLDGSAKVPIADISEAVQGNWILVEGTIHIPKACDTVSLIFDMPGNGDADFYMDDLSIVQITRAEEDEDFPSIKETYQDYIPYWGTCVSYNGWGATQIKSPNTMSFVKKHYNSITLENEMKPNSILGGQVNKVSLDEAQKEGLVIPDNYPEDFVPSLNFETIDGVMELAAANDLKLRGHTLQWHQQTPSWFFTKGYSGGQVTDPDIMDARLEYYVKNVVKHVIDKEISLGKNPGDIVYVWDVSNEYLHRTSDPDRTSWVDVYGNLGMKPTYVKKAFEVAYSVLKDYNAQESVKLFVNDYNTYDEVKLYLSLVEYINEGEEANICGGFGMQSHIDVQRPTLEHFLKALDAFIATGLEVQLTELDVTINYANKNAGLTDDDQTAYVKELMAGIVSSQKNRPAGTKGITGVSVWGLYDSVSWRRESNPLFFKYFSVPKDSYYEVIAAAEGFKN